MDQEHLARAADLAAYLADSLARGGELHLSDAARGGLWEALRVIEESIRAALTPRSDAPRP